MLRYVAYLHAWLGFGQPSLVFVVKRRVEKEGKVAEGTAKGSKRALRGTLHTSVMSKDDVGDQLWAAGRTFATLHSVDKSSKSLISSFVKVIQSVWKWSSRFEFSTFFSYSSKTFDLFYAVKTMLSKLENLWFLRSKKVNFDGQYWLRCWKKVKSHRMIGEKINVARFARNVVKWDFLCDFHTPCSRN